MAWFQFYRSPASELDLYLRLAWLAGPAVLGFLSFVKFKALRKSIVMSAVTYFFLFCCLGMTQGAISNMILEFLQLKAK